MAPAFVARTCIDVACRIATFEDIPTLVELAKEFHEMSFLKRYDFSPSGAKTVFQAMISNPNTVVIMHRDGLIGGGVSDYPFCDVRLAKETFWYARKRSGAGIRLLKRYMQWVDESGAQLDIMSAMVGIDNQDDGVVMGLLERMSYRLMEHTMVRVI